MKNTKIFLFEGKKVRTAWYNNEWWFVIVDAVAILTDSANPAGYIKDMRRRDAQLSKGWGQIATPLAVDTAGGKQQINCANTEGILRIIQSIPSSKAEPFKIWLAKVGYDRIKEIENPELAANRAREIYRAKGYPQSWIEKRMRGIEVRETLTSEWKNRGAKEGIEYAILTNEILSGTFDMSAEDYKKFKGLKRQNLRDHMDDLELILTMLGEATTTRIHRDRDSKGFEKLKDDAKEGGAVAGSTRKDIEKRTGKKVISKKNFLSLRDKKKRSLEIKN